MDAVFTEIMVVIMAIMCVIIVVINTLCIYIILSSKILRQKTTSIFILSILFTHMIQGLFVIPFYTAKKAGPTELWSKKVICDGFRFSYMITFYGMCLNVLLISIDRFLAVNLLTKYKTVVTRTRVKIATVGMWLYIFILCIIPFCNLERSVSNKQSICSYNQPREWTIFMLLTNTLVVYIVITSIYTYIFIKMYWRSRRMHSQRENSMTEMADHNENTLTKQRTRTQSTKNKNEITIQRLTTVTFVIVLTYGLTWAPSILYYLMVSLTPNIFTKEFYVSDTESYITFWIKFITFFDAIGAPILYCYFHQDFRDEFKKLCARVVTPKKSTKDDMVRTFIT